MKAASLKEIKTELNQRSTQELLELCLRLSKFKKENKELLTYLLFESEDEEAFIQSIKTKVDADFETINTKTYFYIKKASGKFFGNLKNSSVIHRTKKPKLNFCFIFVKS